MDATARASFREFREQVSNNLRREELDLFGPLPGDIEQARLSLEDALAAELEPTGLTNLIRSCAAADIVLVGDYHPLPRAQANFTFLVRRLKTRGRNVTVILESIPEKAARPVDLYLTGRLNRRDLTEQLSRCRPEPWEWRSLIELLDWARKEGIRIVPGDLPVGGHRAFRQRERWLANRLVCLHAKNPEDLFVCLVGDLHLAPGFLPLEIDRCARRRGWRLHVRHVHQNPDCAYQAWVDDESSEDTAIYRAGPGAYALVNAPPAVRIASHLDQAPHVLLDGGEARHEWAIQLLERTVGIGQQLASFLDIPSSGLQALEVFGPHELEEFLTRARAARASGTWDVAFLGHQARSTGLAWDPLTRCLHMRDTGLNQMAEGAMVALLASRPAPAEGPPILDRFLSSVVERAVGMAGTRILNPFRRPLAARALRRCAGTAEEYAAAHAIAAAYSPDSLSELGQWQTDMGRALRDATPRAAMVASVSIGQALGCRIYVALRNGHACDGLLETFSLAPGNLGDTLLLLDRLDRDASAAKATHAA